MSLPVTDDKIEIVSPVALRRGWRSGGIALHAEEEHSCRQQSKVRRQAFRSHLSYSGIQRAIVSDGPVVRKSH
jgi:ribosomal protein L4